MNYCSQSEWAWIWAFQSTHSIFCFLLAIFQAQWNKENSHKWKENGLWCKNFAWKAYSNWEQYIQIIYLMLFLSWMRKPKDIEELKNLQGRFIEIFTQELKITKS